MIASFPALLTELSDHTEPRLTWYGPESERVELSGRVLANWVVKSTNLLTEELGIDAGDSVELALPTHWRTVVLALAAWTAGASVRLPRAAGTHGIPEATLIATDRPTAVGGPQLAIALAPLSTRFTDDLCGATDYAAQVLGFGDSLGWVNPPDPDSVALAGGETAPVTFATLLLDAGQLAERDHLAGRRVLVRTGSAPGNGPSSSTLSCPGTDEVLLAALAALGTGGSVVLAAPEVDGLHHLATAERCTAVWPAAPPRGHHEGQGEQVRQLR